MRESDIEKYLVKRVTKLGGEVRKVQWIGRRGAPDRLVMLPQLTTIVRGHVGPVRAYVLQEAKTIWVELKAPGERPKTHQFKEHARMRAMGQRVEVIDSLEGVDRLLGAHK